VPVKPDLVEGEVILSDHQGAVAPLQKWRPRVRGSVSWVGVLSLLGAAFAGGALLFGAFLGARTVPPPTLLAIGSSEGLLLANADNSGPRTIAEDGPYFLPEWSADGTMVATTAVIGDEGNMLTLFAADGSRVTRIPGVEGLRWSPVAGDLAISALPAPRLHVVSLVPASGDAPEAVTLSLPPGARRIVGFDWAPDGRKLAVAVVLGADPEAMPGLWLVPADGGEEWPQHPTVALYGPSGARPALVLGQECDDGLLPARNIIWCLGGKLGGDHDGTSIGGH
jgi:hypothetical protein